MTKKYRFGSVSLVLSSLMISKVGRILFQMFFPVEPIILFAFIKNLSSRAYDLLYLLCLSFSGVFLSQVISPQPSQNTQTLLLL